MPQTGARDRQVGARPNLAAQARARAEEFMSPRPSVASRDRGTQSPEYGGEPPVAGRGAPAVKPLWSGSGGRWLLWPLRIVLRAAILIIGYRGISAIVLNEKPSTASSGNSAAANPVPSGPSFLMTLGSANTLQFGRVHLNFSPNNATVLARELAAFIPANARELQPQFDWTGAGTIQLESDQVAGVDVRSAHTAMVTVLATVNGSLVEIGVPLYACGRGIVVPGEPAWLPTPSAVSPPNSPAAASDPAAQTALGESAAGLLPGISKWRTGDAEPLPRAGGLGRRARRRGDLRVDRQHHGPTGRRDTRHNGDGQLSAVWPGQPGCTATRDNFRCFGNRPATRQMVCKGDPCIYAADGDPMTWFTSPLVVPCSRMRTTEGARRPAPGLRHPGQLTDVHGREG
jgi:hypothetical protein